MPRHNAKLLLIATCLLFTSLLGGCQSGAKSFHDHPSSEQLLKTSVSANFAPDGRLWRLTPTQDAVFIQSSSDNGKSYSQAVRVNPVDQRIDAWPENPPIVEVTPSGRIYVLYYANEAQKSTSFFTYSDDNGLTFSKPVLVSDHADTARNYMDKMLIDSNGKLYMFWHDTRHERHDVAGSLSLYFTATDNPASGQFQNIPVSDNICSCCRTATALTNDNRPMLFARMVFADGSRDHALIKMTDNGTWLPPQRVTHDGWKIEACPEHGPAMAIDKQGRTHLTWFTQGDKRQGLYYAHSDDDGKTMSEPIPLGNKTRLPGHADVLALDEKVALTWQEFDGEQIHIMVMTSSDRGTHWSAPREMAKTSLAAGFPRLITNHKQLFLSWADNNSHQLIEIAP